MTRPVRRLGRALDRAPHSPLFPLAALALFVAACGLFWLLLVVTS